MVITLDEIQVAGARADELQRQSRELLVGTVRKAARDGYSQRDIAAAINRSQPEVSRLLRFMPKSEHGKTLASHRTEILALAKAHGFSNVRVFGSTARGTDGEESDIDLLVERVPGSGLMALARLEIAISTLLAIPVDVVPERSLRRTAVADVLREAIPL